MLLDYRPRARSRVEFDTVRLEPRYLLQSVIAVVPT